MKPVTTKYSVARARRALDPYVVSEPDADGEQDAHCPLHDDGKRSARINFAKGLWCCHAGCGGGTIEQLLELVEDWTEPPAAAKRQKRRPPKPPEDLPSDDQIAAWHEALLGDKKRLKEFQGRRGLNLETIKTYELGWDAGVRAYTVPIRDADGALQNVRRYRPGGNLWSVRGHGTPRLYPEAMLAEDRLVVCEGELDALSAIQAGFPAVSGTGGATHWNEAWSPLFKGKRIVTMYDRDPAGEKGAAKAAASLASYAEVWIGRVPLKEPGSDVTDLFVTQGWTADRFREQLHKAKLYKVAKSGQDDPWPTMAEAAYYGMAGDVVRAIGPYTEADPVALLLDFLVSIGNVVGYGPHAFAGSTEHPGKLNLLIVGKTSRSRKGTSRNDVHQVMRAAASEWATDQIKSGLSSGEGLISALDGVSPESKRLLLDETEFSRVLKVCRREGNPLSEIIRQLYDRRHQRVMTKKPLIADDTHVSIIGHITEEGLKRYLTEMDMADGFANRFIVAMVRRGQILPSGEPVPIETLMALGRRVAKVIKNATSFGHMKRTPAAELRWAEIYHTIAARETAGLVDAMTARAEANVLRLSVVYAVLDKSEAIDLAHVEAAWAVWRYCEESVAHIFGDATGDEIADRILTMLRAVTDRRLTRGQINDRFGGNIKSKEIEGALGRLERQKRVQLEEETGTGGRPRQWVQLV